MIKDKYHFGKVVDGIGNSSKWMPLYLPNLFPGTLNIEMIDSLPEIHWHTLINTHWGKPIKISDCFINDIKVNIILPPLANQKKRPRLIELGYTKKIRNFLDLKNEDIVKITYL